MVSTVCKDDLVVHKTYFFDLLTLFDALKGHKQLRFFPLCTMDARLNAGVLTLSELPCWFNY